MDITTHIPGIQSDLADTCAGSHSRLYAASASGNTFGSHTASPGAKVNAAVTREAAAIVQPGHTHTHAHTHTHTHARTHARTQTHTRTHTHSQTLCAENTKNRE